MSSAWLDIVLFLIVFSLLCSPGIVFASLVHKSWDLTETITRGAVLGLAFAVFLSFALSYARVALFWPALVIAAASLLVLYHRHGGRFQTAIRPPTRGLLLLVLALVAATRFGPTFYQLMPPGGDPAFHLLLAKKIAQSGRMIRDWIPFEPIDLNYPVGSHGLLVQFTSLTGLPLHTAFKLLIPMLGVLMTAQIYFFAARVSKKEEIGLYAAAAYGMLAIYGSIDYYRWGGLPNQLAMCFFIEGLTLLTARDFGRKKIAQLGLLSTATFFTHHHVMIVSALSYGSLCLYYLTFGRDRRLATNIVLSGLVALALGAFYIIPYILKSTAIRDTNVFKFEEIFFDWTLIAASVGPTLLYLALAGGLYCAVQAVKGRAQDQSAVLWVVSALLVVLFVLTGYVYRWIALKIYGTDYVAFTPSRFLTDLTYFLAVLAGYGAFALQRLTRIPTAVVALAVCAGGWWNLAQFKNLYQPTMNVERWNAYRWIERNMSPHTIVMTDDPFAPYAAWRRTPHTPVPISEPTGRVKGIRTGELVAQKLSGARNQLLDRIELVTVKPASALRPSDIILWQSPSGQESVVRYPTKE